MAGDGRSYVTGYYGLNLDGVDCGMIQHFEGGDIEGEATSLPAAPDALATKHIGNVKYNDFALKLGLSMAQPVKDWIDASLSMNYMRKSGELKAADFKREFKDALITEIGFPAVGDGAKDAAFLTLKFSPWIVRNKPGDGALINDPAGAEQKSFPTHNFTLQIDGVSAAAKVSHVDGITIKQSAQRDDVGDARPAHTSPPVITLTLPEADAGDFKDWHQDFVINGNNDESKHKTGSLIYLDATRQAKLLRLDLSGIAIASIKPAPRGDPADKTAKVRVALTVKRIRATF